jgi:hypothetical protein
MDNLLETDEKDVYARLAVIESKLEAVLGELSTIRSYIPGKMVEHSERIVVLERSLRSIQWIGGVFTVAVIGAFIGHVLK